MDYYIFIRRSGRIQTLHCSLTKYYYKNQLRAATNRLVACSVAAGYRHRPTIVGEVEQAVEPHRCMVGAHRRSPVDF